MPLKERVWKRRRGLSRLFHERLRKFERDGAGGQGRKTAFRWGESIVGELVVFITASTQEEALLIGRRLVEKKLAACVTVVPHVTSIFEWEGTVTEERECFMVLKSNADAYPFLEAEVKASHSYDVPEILALPVVRGSRAYLTWLHAAITVPNEPD